MFLFFFNAPMHARIHMMMGIVSNNDGGISLTMMEASYMEMGQDQQHWGLIHLTNKRGGISSIMMRMSHLVFLYEWRGMHIQRHPTTVRVPTASKEGDKARWVTCFDSNHCNLEMHKIPQAAEIASSNSMNNRNAGTTSTNCPCEAPCLPNLPPAPDFLRRESWFHDFHSLSSMERSWTFAPARKSESAACAGRVRASMRHWCIVAFDDAWIALVSHRRKPTTSTWLGKVEKHK